MPNNPTFQPPNRPNWIDVSGDALVDNIRQLRSIIGPNPLLTAVVKANAYGHGAAVVAPVAQAHGADRFAVAALSEAVELREHGIEKPILVLGYTPARLADDAVRHRVQLTVYDLENARQFSDVAARLGLRMTVHIKVNTGMNRLGTNVAEAPALIRALSQLDSLDVEGIYTHFASSDLRNKDSAYRQFSSFQRLLAELSRTGLRPPIAHAANSAAVLSMPETHLDMVRAGIAIYGLAPDADETPLPGGFTPVLTWKAEVAQVRTLEAGNGVSYGHEFVAMQRMTAAIIPVGYADGFPRRPLTWGSVLIRGRYAPILGRVCMDQTVVDVTKIVAESGEMRIGEEVVLIGKQGVGTLSAEEAGRRTGTINYDVVSRILSRVPRRLVWAERD